MFTLLNYTDTPMPQIDINDCNWYESFVDTFNTLDHFDIVALADIPVGEKYCVYMSVEMMFVKITHAYTWLATADCDIPRQDHISMPDRIWTDSGNGLVHWIFAWESEANIDTFIDFARLLHAINCAEYPANMTYGTACEISNDIRNEPVEILRDKFNCNVFKFNTLFHYCYQAIDDPQLQIHIHNKTTDIINRNILDYKGVCYNRRGRVHRAMIISHMIHELYAHQYIHSFGCPEELEERRWDLHDKISGFNHLKDTYTALAAGPPIYPVGAAELLDYTENQAHEITYSHAINASFHVVTETVPVHTEYPGGRSTFITEKSYKPFYMMQPFINFGNKHTIKTLKHSGYKTFDRWIDHSYDDIDDVSDRLRMFLVEMDRLYNISAEQWAEMLYEMLPDLLHNAELVTMPQFNNNLQLVMILAPFFIS